MVGGGRACGHAMRVGRAPTGAEVVGAGRDMMRRGPGQAPSQAGDGPAGGGGGGQDR